jgi:hypothetical protein
VDRRQRSFVVFHDQHEHPFRRTGQSSDRRRSEMMTCIVLRLVRSRRLRRRGRAVLTAALGGLVALTGCSVSGLGFRADERVHITAPTDRSTVLFPIEIAWTAHDVAVGEGAGLYGVFIDTAPPAHDDGPADLLGETGRQICATEATSADGAPTAGAVTLQVLARCPATLAQRGMYLTTSTALSVSALPAGQRQSGLHTATIVLLDRAGRRDGESAFATSFRVKAAP